MDVIQFLPKELFGLDPNDIVIRLKNLEPGILPTLGRPSYPEATEPRLLPRGLERVNDPPADGALEIAQQGLQRNFWGKGQQEMIMVGQDDIAHHIVAILPSVEAQVIEKDLAVLRGLKHLQPSMCGSRNVVPAAFGWFVSSLHNEPKNIPAAGAAGLNRGWVRPSPCAEQG
jgi:hypothetical protein